jgi:hypothetical protein
MIIQIDTRKIKPGDSLSQGDCEAVIGFTADSNPLQWQFALLQLLGVVQKQLKERTRAGTDGANRRARIACADGCGGRWIQSEAI